MFSIGLFFSWTRDYPVKSKKSLSLWVFVCPSSEYVAKLAKSINYHVDLAVLKNTSWTFLQQILSPKAFIDFSLIVVAEPVEPPRHHHHLSLKITTSLWMWTKNTCNINDTSVTSTGRGSTKLFLKIEDEGYLTIQNSSLRLQIVMRIEVNGCRDRNESWKSGI